MPTTLSPLDLKFKDICHVAISSEMKHSILQETEQLKSFRKSQNLTRCTSLLPLLSL